MKKEELNKFVETTAKELFDLAGIGGEIVVSENEEEDYYNVVINAPNETGLIIGNRGETLQAFQEIISLIVRQKVGDWVRIVLDVGDYRKKQKSYLENLAKESAERAKETGEEQNLYNLSASQRRVVHMFLSQIEGIESESRGEDRDRYLVVVPKKE